MDKRDIFPLLPKNAPVFGDPSFCWGFGGSDDIFDKGVIPFSP